MSRQKLTIVVTCTDRKSAPPSEALSARSLPAGNVTERAEEWGGRLRRAQSKYRLVDLYQGGSWAQSKALAATARSLGWQPEILIASAGLGLRRTEDRAPSYAATFARGQADSVAATADDASAWWDLLPHADAPHPDNPAIWVLSEAYASAMARHLESLNPDTSLVFGGAPGTCESVRIRSDRTLRCALGGTLTSLNTRMAIRWLEIAGSQTLTSPSIRKAWDDWVRTASKPESHNRRRLSDDSLRLLIQDLRTLQPDISKTVALRKLRASGVACEQHRFSDLFGESSQQ